MRSCIYCLTAGEANCTDWGKTQQKRLKHPGILTASTHTLRTLTTTTTKMLWWTTFLRNEKRNKTALTNLTWFTRGYSQWCLLLLSLQRVPVGVVTDNQLVLRDSLSLSGQRCGRVFGFYRLSRTSGVAQISFEAFLAPLATRTPITLTQQFQQWEGRWSSNSFISQTNSSVSDVWYVI